MASQPGLPNTGTASLRRTDMGISPQRRGFGGGNRNVWEQMDSTEGPVCADKAPSHQVRCSSVAPGPRDLGKARPQAPGTRCTPRPSPVRRRAAGTGHTCTVSQPRGTRAHRLRLAGEAPAPHRPSALRFPLAYGAPCARAGIPSLGSTRHRSPACRRGRTGLGTWDTQTWAHDQAGGTGAVCQPCHTRCHSHCLLSSFNVPAQPAPTAQPAPSWAGEGTGVI